MPQVVVVADSSRSFRIAIIGLAVILFELALIQPWSVFWLFAFLPGIIGIGNYVVTSRHRHDAGSTAMTEGDHAPTKMEVIIAAMLLTSVFCVLARNVESAELSPDDGLVYAGYGAYISTLWFMLVRLNASALTPRFMINSALKSSIAMVIGYVAAMTEVFKTTGPGFFFLIGLCHAWALAALKKIAMGTFGIKPVVGPADLSVRQLEGIDDDAMDVLEELGITSVQHLATMRPDEVCGRSLYPRDRVLDWIDQSLLAVHTNGKIAELRALGIRSADALVIIAESGTGVARERLEEAERRIGIPPGAMQLVTHCIDLDPVYRELRESRRPSGAKTSGGTAQTCTCCLACTDRRDSIAPPLLAP